MQRAFRLISLTIDSGDAIFLALSHISYLDFIIPRPQPMKYNELSEFF